MDTGIASSALMGSVATDGAIGASAAVVLAKPVDWTRAWTRDVDGCGADAVFGTAPAVFATVGPTVDVDGGR
ncbi:hypothetical protein H7K45_01475 [Mycobacterium yunnanensis]|uniref:Uncharacterized protein n=1 Tax=Mycobacterium yunnanensis TaxID=368477 RepID=A0A9X2YUI0_9MYCO|nr:hypothetical protein [Mycobacterium yunnanensis]MCV7419200.1 hypothetical protein [Mycobacterium yunnanensis]